MIYLLKKLLLDQFIIDNRAFDEITDSSIRSSRLLSSSIWFHFSGRLNELAFADKPFDLVSVCANVLTDMGKLEVIGGQSQLLNLLKILLLLQILLTTPDC
jgi:replicative DNA helicase